MNAPEYNRAIAGHVWSLKDLPSDWAGYGILVKADLDGDFSLSPEEKHLPDWAAFTELVRTFQKKNFLKPDGMLGPNTFEKLVQAYDRDIENIIHWAGPLPIMRSTRPTFPPEGKPCSGRTWLERRICNLWNCYGGAICRAADTFDLPVKAALAVFSVESGRAYDAGTGRIVIRFENRTVWRKVYGHEQISNSHRNQDAEWSALGMAASLHMDHAVMSASWGLGQVMGFNHKVVGYENPLDMVRAFQDNVEAQVLAFFQFCRHENIDGYITSQDWGRFVRRYNGSRPGSTIFGQYTKGLADAYQAIGDMNRRGIRFLEG
jgi:hypothetical protein